MYMYMYVYVYVYIYIHRCVYIYIYMYVCMYVCMYIHIYVCIYIYIYVCMCVCIYIYIYIYIYIHTSNKTILSIHNEQKQQNNTYTHNTQQKVAGRDSGRGPGDLFWHWSQKGEVLRRGVGTLRYLLPPNASVQGQPDGLTIHTQKWFLGAGFLGAPPISLSWSILRPTSHSSRY